MTKSPALQQISLSLSGEENAVVAATSASHRRHLHDLSVVRKSVLEQNGGPLTIDLNERHSPYNIAMTPAFSDHIRSLHKLLDKALIDIVDRWYSDKEAHFPSRMPVEKHEDDLLRWIAGYGSDIVRPFSSNYGMWRTDFLVDRDSDGAERAVICEINSRIPFNGFWVVGLHERATELFGAKHTGLISPNDFETTRKAIFDCFDTTKPVHHIRSKWPGVDSHCLAREYEKRFGQSFLTVEPSQLRLVSDKTSSKRQRLFYLPKADNDGNVESLQEIQQCSLELFQDEYGEIEPQILQQIATCCVNDIRNVFLVHDKRILGIILEEIPGLKKRGILTSEEGSQLEQGIANTLLAGTQPMKDLLRQSQNDTMLKDRYIIKPVRDAACNGIQLGSKITQEEWLDILQQHAQRPLLPSEGACVIQELVDHIWYDIMRHDIDPFAPEKFHLIGSHHLINSKLDIHGPWRIGEDIHVGFSPGRKGIVMSCVLRPDGIPIFQGKDE